jgi:hypothetical protein
MELAVGIDHFSVTKKTTSLSFSESVSIFQVPGTINACRGRSLAIVAWCTANSFTA